MLFHSSGKCRRSCYLESRAELAVSWRGLLNNMSLNKEQAAALKGSPQWTMQNTKELHRVRFYDSDKFFRKMAVMHE